MNVLSQITRVNSPAVIVKYGDCRLDPAPLIDWTVEPITDDAGVRQANKTRLVLSSSIVILPSGSYEQMYTEQQNLRNAFGVDGLDFTITAGPANKTLAEGAVISSGLKPNVTSINIAPGVQVDRFDYTVELEDSTAASGISGVVDNFSNQWTFRENSESCVLDITHVVNAEGIAGEPDAFQQAMRKVKANLGIDKLPIDLPYFTEPNASGDFNITHPSNPTGFNDRFEVSVQREEVADVANGTYSVTEVFTMVSGVPFYYTSRNQAFTEDSTGIANVTIQGQIQGLGRTNTPGLGLDGGVGFQRASSGFINTIRPLVPLEASGVYETYKLHNAGSGLIISNPISVSITENRCRGTIDFSFEYTDDPSALLPSGIASFQSSVAREDGIRAFVSHPIPLRRLGPIIQDIATTTEGRVTLQCQAQSKNTGDKTVDTNRAIDFVEDELNRLRVIHANSSNFESLRIESLTQNNSDSDLTANATIIYVFTVDLADVADVNSSIILARIS